jgi:predicted helicase
MDLPKILHAVFLRSPQNLFDEFLIECQKWYSEPAHTLTEMRTRDNKKIRGDIFEEFCVLYLKHVKGYKTVWLLEDVPEDILAKLSMKRKDMGIDIVVNDGTNYMAVQCKYKTNHSKSAYTAVSWQALSTFYALCMRTGPWSQYIVMTNCDYVRHQGKKTDSDVSIALNKLRLITKDEWLTMCEIKGNCINLSSEELARPSPVQLRELRLAYYSNIPNKTPT